MKLPQSILGIWMICQESADLIGESEIVFQPNPVLKRTFFRRVKALRRAAGAVNLSLSWPILFASVTTLIIVGFFLGVLSTS